MPHFNVKCIALAMHCPTCPIGILAIREATLNVLQCAVRVLMHFHQNWKWVNRHFYSFWNRSSLLSWILNTAYPIRSVYWISCFSHLHFCKLSHKLLAPAWSQRLNTEQVFIYAKLWLSNPVWSIYTSYSEQ